MTRILFTLVSMALVNNSMLDIAGFRMATDLPYATQVKTTTDLTPVFLRHVTGLALAIDSSLTKDGVMRSA